MTIVSSDIEVSLLSWFIQCIKLNIPINWLVLIEKSGLLLLNLAINNLNLDKVGWKRRNNFVFCKICGENTLIDWIVNYLQTINLNNHYSHYDVYNVEEIGLFFKFLPIETLVLDEIIFWKEDLQFF